MRKKRPRSLVLFGNGINCEMETAHAHRLAGFEVTLHHINDLMNNMEVIHDFVFITLPGGFLDGDDLGSAKAQAVKWRYQKRPGTEERFIDELMRFINEGKLILGICNGFQLLVKTGLLPGIYGEYGRQAITLTFNDSGRFEDRWVYLKVTEPSRCIFTKDIGSMYLPVRHGEGKLTTGGDDTLREIKMGGYMVMQYVDKEGRPTDRYPYNPNGSQDAIAGLTDPTGRILGLMPHPEAYVHFTHHPRWTRDGLPEEGDGLKIFCNAFEYVVDNLL